MSEYKGCERNECPCGGAVNCSWFKKKILESCAKECSLCNKNEFCPFGDTIINDWKKTRKKDLESDIFNEWYKNSYKSSPTMADTAGNG
ncbi:MAG: hypothetical protein WA063_06885 [Minisyncoccia bacterium]